MKTTIKQFSKTPTYNTQKMEKKTQENKKSGSKQLLKNIVEAPQPDLFRRNFIHLLRKNET